MSEVDFARLGLTQEIIQKVFELVEAEDARLASAEFDKLHRGNNRWGHCLAALRRELKRHGWTWATDPQGMRLIVAPDNVVQISVAAASELGFDKGPMPSTHPKGKYTQIAVNENKQLLLPHIFAPTPQPESSVVVENSFTWLLLHERTYKSEAKSIEYRYELSLPLGLSGEGERQRVHEWGPRLFRGSVTFDATIEEVPDEERFDAGDDDVPTIEVKA